MKQFKIKFDQTQPDDLLAIYRDCGNETPDAILSKKSHLKALVPIFTSMKDLNKHFLGKYAEAFKGLPDSTAMQYLLLSFYDIGDDVPPVDLLKIMKAIYPQYARDAWNAIAKFQTMEFLKNKRFCGVTQEYLTRTFTKYNLQLPEERIERIIRPLGIKAKPKPVFSTSQREESLFSTENQMALILSELKTLKDEMKTNKEEMKTALEETLLTHDERVDKILTLLPYTEKITAFIGLVKDMTPEQYQRFMAVVEPLSKAFK